VEVKQEAQIGKSSGDCLTGAGIRGASLPSWRRREDLFQRNSDAHYAAGGRSRTLPGSYEGRGVGVRRRVERRGFLKKG